MVNNFIQIKSMLTFDKETDFYFIQILKRRKDNPGLSRDVKLIDTYYVYSIEDMGKLEERIIEKCQLNNARAYIHLNRRNLENVGLQTLRKITELVIQKDFKAIKSAYHSCCGMYSDEKDLKKWIIDIDDLSQKYEIKQFIENLYQDVKQFHDKGYKIIAEIPTRNGCHLIVNPFPKDKFKAKFPNVDVHSDNPTLLMAP